MFITLEGIEGSGKSTQIASLARYLRGRGASVLTTREPGGCLVADAVRALLLDPTHGSMTPRCELLLYAAARAQHIEEVIRPALDRGEVVLCDRFTDATLAYQGAGRGLDRALIEELNNLATGGLTPDLTLLLDLPAVVGLERVARRGALTDGAGKDRIEREALEFHERVRDGYLEMADTTPRFRVVDGSKDTATVSADLQALVEPFLGERGRP